MAISNKSPILILMIVILGILQSVESYAESEVDIPQFDYTRYYDSFLLENRFDGVFYSNLEGAINQLSPNVGGDAFHEFDLPLEIIEQMSEKEIDALLYQALVSFHTLEGILYFSHSRQQYRLFIEQSYVVSSVTDRNPQSDWQLQTNAPIPTLKDFFVYQKDTSFGDGVKKISIYYDPDTHQFYARIINKETIKYLGVFPIADAEEFIVSLYITRVHNKIRMYGISAIQADAFRFIRERISTSVVYRMYALAKWFEEESISIIMRNAKSE